MDMDLLCTTNEPPKYDTYDEKYKVPIAHRRPMGQLHHLLEVIMSLAAS
jgi:hypothetical protein